MVGFFDGIIFLSMRRNVFFPQGEIRQILLGIPQLEQVQEDRAQLRLEFSLVEQYGLKPQTKWKRICWLKANGSGYLNQPEGIYI